MADDKLTDLYSALDSAKTVMALSSQDWGAAGDFAWLYGIFVGWDNDPTGGDVDQDGSALDELATRFRWDAETVARLRRLRAAVEAFDINALTAAGRLLPPGGEVGEEWVMRWRHPSSSRLDQTPNFGSERRARQAALSCAKYGGVDVSVHRRDVHVWSDGTHLIGPWSPVVSDNQEADRG